MVIVFPRFSRSDTADLMLRTILDPAMAISNDIMAAFKMQWMMTSVLVMFDLQRPTVSLPMTHSSAWKTVE